MCGDGLDVGGNGIRAERTSNTVLCVLRVLIGGGSRASFLFSSLRGAVAYLCAVEAYNPHQGLGSKEHGVDVPKEGQTCHNPHHVNKDHGGEGDVA